MKLVITGYPRTGKTTLAGSYGVPVLHTDDLLRGTMAGNIPAAAEVAEWFDRPGDWVIEGVLALRAVRTWLRTHPGQPFPAPVMWLSEQKVDWPNKGTMRKAMDTVWAEVMPQLGTVVLEADWTLAVN